MRAAVVAVSLLVACGSPARPAVSHAPIDGTPGCPALRAEPLVDETRPPPTAFELFDPGADPQRALRYAPHDVRQRLVIDADVDVDIGSGDGLLPLPRVTVHLVHEARIDDDGAVAHRFVVERSEVARRGTPDDATAALLIELDRARCGSLAVRTDARGIVERTTQRGLNAPARQSLELVELALHALPDEPVGAGATWTFTTPRVIGGVHLDVTTDVELVALDGDVATLTGTITGKAPAQTIERGDLALDVSSLRVSHLFDLSIDLRTLRVEGSARLAMALEGSDDSGDVSVQTRTTVRIRPE